MKEESSLFNQLVNELKMHLTSEKEFNKWDKLLYYISENSLDETETLDTDFNITVIEEKIHSLQFDIEIYIEKDGIELILNYEDGINNGTRLNSYDIRI